MTDKPEQQPVLSIQPKGDGIHIIATKGMTREQKLRLLTFALLNIVNERQP